MDIVFIGGQYWDGPWFRKHQFAKRLSDKGHRVFYVEDSTSIIRLKKTNNNHPIKTTVKKLNDNLFIIIPPAFFPFPQNYIPRSIYNLRFLYDLKRILQTYKVQDYVFWFNKTEYCTILDKISAPKILDLCDDLPGYCKLANNENLYKKQMRFLAESLSKSDLAIVSAQKIKEKYNYLTTKDILVIPNGHNINVDNNNNFSHLPPPEFDNIKRPIVGFIGTLFHFIDDDLLEYLISRRPQYSFVFVGGLESSFPIDKIKKYKNVFILGKKPQSTVNSYITFFDVCINTFRIHDVNDSVNPVKVFEYLANRKQVISTNMYSLKKEKVAEYITFADTYEDFLIKLDKQISSHENNIIPDNVLKSYHWDFLFNQLLKGIRDKIGLEF